MKLAHWIDPFAPADGDPPQTLLPFFRWTLKGCGTALALAAVLSIAAGVVEAAPDWALATTCRSSQEGDVLSTD